MKALPGAVAPADTRSVTRILEHARREEGIALITAILIMGVMAMMGTAVIHYSGSNSRSASYDGNEKVAYSLAEAGVAEAMAVLSQPGNNALDPYLLPERTSTYAEGVVVWSGTLNQSTAVWTITSQGAVANPTGPDTLDVQHTLNAEVEVTPSFSSPANNPVWNYIYAKRTGDPDGCDEEIRNSGVVNAPLYVDGNLCIGQTTRIVRGPLVVKGKLTLENPQNAVGASNAKISDAHIGNGCKYRNHPYHNPCQGPPDNVHALVLDTVMPPVEWPEPAWSDWYLNGSPGPYYPCYETSGTPPTFDNDQGSPTSPNPAMRNTSVPGVFHLTPPASYTCRTAGGELSWDAATRTLTAQGTIYIDGSAKVENGQINQYAGQATIYLSGTLLIKNSSLCAGVSASGCDAANWNPNTELLIFVADGSGGQLSAGNGIEIVSGDFQGGLLATGSIDIGTTSNSDGPLLGDTIILGQSFNSSFPFITIVPAGAPTQPIVYAQPGTPRIYG